ncbi:hypothetical protein CKA32_002791 [Geitlerinema sp. FC II]|nr:hypothetical protein CKA32_002791 [Geitlerinema sp. FC II]
MASKFSRNRSFVSTKTTSDLPPRTVFLSEEFIDLNTLRWGKMVMAHWFDLQLGNYS